MHKNHSWIAVALDISNSFHNTYIYLTGALCFQSSKGFVCGNFTLGYTNCISDLLYFRHHDYSKQIIKSKNKTQKFTWSHAATALPQEEWGDSGDLAWAFTGDQQVRKKSGKSCTSIIDIKFTLTRSSHHNVTKNTVPLKTMTQNSNLLSSFNLAKPFVSPTIIYLAPSFWPCTMPNLKAPKIKKFWRGKQQKHKLKPIKFYMGYPL